MRPQRRRARRILRWFAVAATLLVVLALLLPTVLSMDWMRVRVERALGDTLGAPARVGAWSFGWLSGVEIADVHVANPPGFAGADELLALRRLDAAVALGALVHGRVDLSGTAEGLALRIRRRPDGTTNLDALRERATPGGSGAGSGAPRSTPADVRFAFALRDATVELIDEERGSLVRLVRIEARVAKEFDAAAVEATGAFDVATADAAAGHVDLRFVGEPDRTRPIEGRVRCERVDLAALRPLLTTFTDPAAWTALEGHATGELTLAGVPDERLVVGGELAIETARVAGPIVADLDLRGPQWTLRPVAAASLTPDGGLAALDLDGFGLDLGFLTVRGRAAGTAAATVGADVAVDVAALAAAGSLLPDALRGSGTTVTGTVTIPLARAMAGDVAALAFHGEVAIDELRVADHALTGIAAAVAFADGRATVQSRTGVFAGGPLTMQLEVDAKDPAAMPFALTLGVDGAGLDGRAAQGLRYVVPLFAGLDAAALGRAATLTTRGDLTLELAGRLWPREDESVFAWLDEFAGRGRVQLRDGSLAPAPALVGMLQATGQSGRLAFERVGTEFSIARGSVTANAAQLVAKGRQFGLTGRTGFRGDLDWTLDVREMLKEHRDGARILALLGDRPLGAKLTGTLDAPAFALPDLGELAKRALEAALEREGRARLEKEAGDLLDRVFGRKPDGAPSAPKDAIRDAAEELLRGITKPPGGGDGDAKRDGAEPPKSRPVDPTQKALEDLLRQLGRKRG